MVIEKDQGVNHKGQVFGYDHERHNFITWGIKNEKIAVLKVENDDQVEKHGSLAATMRDAKKVAAQENRLPNSSLKRSILMGFERA
jgi:hypothetical protein